MAISFYYIYWFEEIKSGRKTHEYRQATHYWDKRIHWIKDAFELKSYGHNDVFIPTVIFQRAYRKNPERMTFEIKDICLVDGKNTDLHIDGLVFDIELGERLK